MRRFWIWYFSLLRESFVIFKLWGHDWSGWIPMIVAVIVVAGGWFGFSSASFKDAGDWWVAVGTILILVWVLIMGPLIVAYRRHLKDEKDKQSLSRERDDLLRKSDDLLKKSLIFFPEEDRNHVESGGNYHYSVAIKNDSEIKTIKNCVIYWHSSEGRVENVSSVELHRSGASRSQGILSKVDIQPGSHAVYDFLFTSLKNGTPRWFIPVDWNENGVEIPIEERKICLLAAGEDVPPQVLHVRIRPAPNPLEVIVERLSG
jgi:hypothetical protein